MPAPRHLGLRAVDLSPKPGNTREVGGKEKGIVGEAWDGF